MLGQWMTDRRTIRRDIERARQETEVRQRADWLLLQRQSVTAIQDRIEVLWTNIAQLMAGGPGDTAEINVAYSDVYRLSTRLDDLGLRVDLLTWLSSTRQVAATRPDDATVQAVRNERLTLQTRLGDQLRSLHTQ